MDKYSQLMRDLAEAKTNQPHGAEFVGWIVNRDFWRELRKDLEKQALFTIPHFSGKRDEFYGIEIHPEDVSPEKSEIFVDKLELNARLEEIRNQCTSKHI